MPTSNSMPYNNLYAYVTYPFQANILHLDIKSENVLLDQDQVCVLIDFGASGVIDPKKRYYDIHDIGTAGHRSPEIITNQRPTIVSRLINLHYEKTISSKPFSN